MAAKVLAAALMLSASASVMGQKLEWIQRVDVNDTGTGAQHNTEVALAVHRQSNEILVAWMHWADTSASTIFSKVYYNVSLNGVNFQPTSTSIPLPAGASEYAADPMAVYAPDGTAWVGSVQLSTPPHWRDRFWVAKKTFTQATAATAIPVLFNPNFPEPDKGVLAYGKLASSAVEQLVLTYAHYMGAGTENPRRLKGMISPDEGGSWGAFFRVGDDPLGTGNAGGPNRSFILRNGGNVGRWVVAHHRTVPYPCQPPPGTCNPPPTPVPSVTYSDNVGSSGNPAGDWTNAVAPTRALRPSDPGAVAEFVSNHGGTIQSGMVGGTVNTPDLALDPLNNDTMYLIFSGHTPSTGGSSNIDLFIARSIDGGHDFLGEEPEGRNVLHLTDVDLGFGADDVPVHQFLPSITVDTSGGLNIVYYAAKRNPANPTIWIYRVNYARIPQFTTNPHPDPNDIFNLPLTDWFDMENLIAQYHSKTFGHSMMGDSRV